MYANNVITHTFIFGFTKKVIGVICLMPFMVSLIAACTPSHETSKTDLESFLGIELPISDYYFYSSCQFNNGLIDDARNDTLGIVYEYFQFESTDEQMYKIVDRLGLLLEKPQTLANYTYMMNISPCRPRWWSISEPFLIFELPSYRYDESGELAEMYRDKIYLLYENNTVYIYKVTGL